MDMPEGRKNFQKYFDVDVSAYFGALAILFEACRVQALDQASRVKTVQEDMNLEVGREEVEINTMQPMSMCHCIQWCLVDAGMCLPITELYKT